MTPLSPSTRPSRSRGILPAVCRGVLTAAVGALAITALAASPLLAETTDLPGDPVPVKVVRVKPKEAKHPTLVFLKENRAFIRSQLDRLATEPAKRESEAGVLDERHLRYRDAAHAISLARDTVAVEDARRAERDILMKITEVAELDAQLDLMETLLADQRSRFDQLEADFAADQVTALQVLLRGVPAGAEVTHVVVGDESGDAVSAALDDVARRALASGGLLEVFHEFVEPREQVLEITIQARGWDHEARAFVVMAPDRDRRNVLELDLARPGELAVFGARAWSHRPAASVVAMRDEADPASADDAGEGRH